MKLRELIADAERRKRLIADACEVLDLEVADKSGISGIAIRGAYAVVKGIKPGFIPRVVDGLLDEFADAVQPLHEQAVAAGQPAGAYIAAHAGDLAAALLAITDRRAERNDNKTLVGLYRRLRPTAEKHVIAAAPRVGTLVERHAAG